MSYYILPKLNHTILIDTFIENIFILREPTISHSLIHYVNDVYDQIKKISQEENKDQESLENLALFIHPYDFLYRKVPNTRFSVSKLKPDTPIFYDLLEMFTMLSLLEPYQEKNMQTIHFSFHSSSSIECMNMLREFKMDLNLAFPLEETMIKEHDIYLSVLQNNVFDLLFFEMDDDNYKSIQSYILCFIKILIHIFYFQKPNGLTIIKIDEIFYKPILDCIFILCNVFEKVYIFKPNSCNILTSEKYIVCKHFIFDANKSTEYDYYKLKLKNILHAYKTIQIGSIYSLVQNPLPYYFINKIEEYNIILGQQQLNGLDQLVSILKSKNQEEKIDALKKSNLQKCILWCEKYKIPNNKFNERGNIFLPSQTITQDI